MGIENSTAVATNTAASLGLLGKILMAIQAMAGHTEKGANASVSTAATVQGGP